MAEVDRKRKRGALEDISNMQPRRMATRSKPLESFSGTQSTNSSQETSYSSVPTKKRKHEEHKTIKVESPGIQTIQERQRVFDIKMNASNSEFDLSIYVDEVTMIDTKEEDALAREIDHYHRKHEEKYRVKKDYLGPRTDITARMRTILLDWLVEVAEEYKVSAKALHLAISLVDRCLSEMAITRGELQLMGCACMMVACKYEEVQCPTIEDFVYISDHTYTGERMLQMEAKVLDCLQFRLSSTHLYHFLERFVLAGCSTDQQTHFAHYISELATLDYETVLQFPPSIIAAAAVYLSRLVTQESTPWTPTLHYYTKYNAVQVLDCVKQLHKVHVQEYNVLQTDANKTKAITDKYASRKHLRVGKLPPATSPSVVVQQPTVKLVPEISSDEHYPELETSNGVDHNGIPIGMWRQDLFACATCIPNALMTFVCPCVSIAQISHRMGLLSYNMMLGMFGLVYIICTICYLVGHTGGNVIAILLGIAMWIYIYRLRMRLRIAFQIPGSMLEDICATFWCSFCAVCQMAAHIESFDKGKCSFAPKEILPGYHL
ncbi:cyclin [Thraustotheca clavata]|uniref:Cyclin n=1 Tax=Thraustotheca clavata TaxID=74557 RepID=A0A1W0A744_9STRA|nr:cyclin [Thraustotheca clavata]